MKWDPRVYIVYLVGVSVGAFVLAELWQVATLCGAQVLLALVARVPPRRLAKRTRKLAVFALLIGLSHALVPQKGGGDEWASVAGVPVNLTGLEFGGLMVLRIMTIVLASQLVRSMDPRAFATGLRRFGLPPNVALSVDTVLALFGGKSGGGKRRREQHGEPEPASPEREGVWANIKRVVRGDVGPIGRMVDERIERASRYVEEQEGGTGKRAADVGVIAGVALAMMAVKALKLLPALPFAPGHKLIVLTPLYVIATLRTRTRFGATWTGLTMGTVAFLMGDGRYGVLEVLKHIVPGLMCDALVPLTGLHKQRPPVWKWLLLGGAMAAGRFATILAVIFLAQAPALAYAIMAPGMALHLTFGVISGYVTHRIALHFDRRDYEESAEIAQDPGGAEPAGAGDLAGVGPAGNTAEETA